MIIEKKIEKRRITEKLFKKKSSNVSGQIKPKKKHKVNKG